MLVAALPVHLQKLVLATAGKFMSTAMSHGHGNAAAVLRAMSMGRQSFMSAGSVSSRKRGRYDQDA